VRVSPATIVLASATLATQGSKEETLSGMVLTDLAASI
jgi:hypothetical protein